MKKDFLDRSIEAHIKQILNVPEEIEEIIDFREFKNEVIYLNSSEEEKIEYKGAEKIGHIIYAKAESYLHSMMHVNVCVVYVPQLKGFFYKIDWREKNKPELLSKQKKDIAWIHINGIYFVKPVNYENFFRQPTWEPIN